MAEKFIDPQSVQYLHDQRIGPEGALQCLCRSRGIINIFSRSQDLAEPGKTVGMVEQGRADHIVYVAEFLQSRPSAKGDPVR